ncbi:MAG TPA: histidinol-phosphate transaminase [Planctomycetota bacterium]|nr:histidinol-phosphate transaminase [Planctomycetota bacterium]
MNYFRANIQSMEPYLPGEQPQDGGFIKLNTNENPYPPCAAVLRAIKAAMNGSMRLYPDPVATRVRVKAAEVFGVSPEMVLVGNGSDDILSIMMRSFVGEGDAVVYLYPSYGLYQVLTEIQAGRARVVHYTDDFRLPPDIRQADAKLTFICSPNNPTGTVISPDEVAELAAQSPGVVCVDEAYADFSDTTCLELVHRFDNVIVIRSFSKSYSLAGLRIGLGIAQKSLIDGMLKVKDSYNVERLGIVGAEAALANVDRMKANVRKIVRSRRRLTKQLEALGFSVLPSQANFIFARPPMPAGELYEKLKARRILVRYWNRPRISDGIRISIGTPDELDALIEAVGEILKSR